MAFAAVPCLKTQNYKRGATPAVTFAAIPCMYADREGKLGATPATKTLHKTAWCKQPAWKQGWKPHEGYVSLIEFEKWQKLETPMRPYGNKRKKPLRPFVVSQRYLQTALRHSEVARILGEYWEKTVVMETESSCMTAKDIRWIIDSGSGFDLISSGSLTQNDQK